MAFSTQKDFLNIGFGNQLQHHETLQKRIPGSLKSYLSCTDARAWSMNPEKRTRFLLDFISSKTPKQIIGDGSFNHSRMDDGTQTIYSSTTSFSEKNSASEQSIERLQNIEEIVQENKSLRESLVISEEKLRIINYEKDEIRTVLTSKDISLEDIDERIQNLRMEQNGSTDTNHEGQLLRDHISNLNEKLKEVQIFETENISLKRQLENSERRRLKNDLLSTVEKETSTDDLRLTEEISIQKVLDEDLSNSEIQNMLQALEQLQHQKQILEKENQELLIKLNDRDNILAELNSYKIRHSELCSEVLDKERLERKLEEATMHLLSEQNLNRNCEVCLTELLEVIREQALALESNNQAPQIQEILPQKSENDGHLEALCLASQATLKQLENEVKQLQYYKNECERLEQVSDIMSSIHETSKTEASILFNDLQEVIETLEQSKKQIAILEQQKCELENEITKISNDFHNYREEVASKEEPSRLLQDIAKLREDYEKQSIEENRLRNIIKNLEIQAEKYEIEKIDLIENEQATHGKEIKNINTHISEVLSVSKDSNKILHENLSEIESLKKQIENYKVGEERLKNTIKSFENKVELLARTEEVDLNTSINEETNKSIKECHQKVEELRNANENHKIEEERLKNIIERLENSNEQQKHEEEKLLNHLEALKQANGSLHLKENIEGEHENCLKKLQELREEIEKISTERDNLQQLLGNKRERSSVNITAEKQEISNDLEKLKEYTNIVEKERDVLKDKLNKVEETLREMEEMKHLRIREDNTEQGISQQDDLQQEQNRLQGLLQNVENDLKLDFNVEKQQLLKTIEELKASQQTTDLRSSEALKELDSLKNQLEDFRKKNQELEQEVNDSQKKLSDQADLIENLNIQIQENLSKQLKLGEIRSEEKINIEKLQVQNDSLEKELYQLRDNLRELKETLEEAEKRIGTQMQQIDDSSRELVTLKEQNEKLASGVGTNLPEDTRNALQENYKFKEKNRKLSNDLKNALMKNQALDEKIIKLEVQTNELEHDLNISEDLHKSMKFENDNLVQKISELEESIIAQTKEMENLNNLLKEEQANTTDHKETMRRFKHEVEIWNKKFEKCRKEYEDNVGKLQERLDDALEECEALKIDAMEADNLISQIEREKKRNSQLQSVALQLEKQLIETSINEMLVTRPQAEIKINDLKNELTIERSRSDALRTKLEEVETERYAVETRRQKLQKKIEELQMQTTVSEFSDSFSNDIADDIHSTCPNSSRNFQNMLPDKNDEFIKLNEIYETVLKERNNLIEENKNYEKTIKIKDNLIDELKMKLKDISVTKPTLQTGIIPNENYTKEDNKSLTHNLQRAAEPHLLELVENHEQQIKTIRQQNDQLLATIVYLKELIQDKQLNQLSEVAGKKQQDTTDRISPMEVLLPNKEYKTNLGKLCAKIINQGIELLNIKELTYLHDEVYRAGLKLRPHLTNELHDSPKKCSKCCNFVCSLPSLEKNEEKILFGRVIELEKQLEKSNQILRHLKANCPDIFYNLSFLSGCTSSNRSGRHQSPNVKFRVNYEKPTKLTKNSLNSERVSASNTSKPVNSARKKRPATFANTKSH